MSNKRADRRAALQHGPLVHLTKSYGAPGKPRRFFFKGSVFFRRSELCVPSSVHGRYESRSACWWKFVARP